LQFCKKLLPFHSFFIQNPKSDFPTKSTNATGAAALAAEFIINTMTIGCFIAVIVNPNFRH
jgi:hypothetical protein